MKKYDQYKNSGVEWLGEIPSHWEVMKLKYVLTEINERSVTGEEELLSLSKSKGVIPKSSLNERSGQANTLVGYKKVYSETIVINKMQAVNGLLAVSKINGITSPDYSIYRIKEDIGNDINYFGYLLNQPDYINEFKKVVTGVMDGFIRLYTDDLFNIKAHIPPSKEQVKIVQFLEEKTTKIDQAIAIKQKQIELLKERRQILVHKAVTRGLNDNVKLKNSGVEWIGEIPEHWDIRRFKFLCHITTGSKNTEDKVDNGKFPFFVRSQKPERINSYTFDGEAILTAGDGAGVGKVFHYLNEKFDFHQRVYKFSNFKNIKGKLLYYYIKNNFHNVALNGEAKSTVDSLRLPLIQNFLVTIPPTEEQIEIISRIETTNKKIATAISLKEQEIEKLKEYKMSLIDAVVTGKVKIC